ncbi:MAG: FkbM family methyltransferase [Steroidobacteraceae bacterium]|nr:FkbM family methyltransferase [Steroidobacteraceae bacterium]
MPTIWFRMLRRLRYEYLRRFENPAVLETRQGIFRVPIAVPDPISRELFLFGSFELELMNEAMELVRRLSGRTRGKGTLIDIGANNGVTSIGMLVTGQLDSAIAIEPEPVNFGRLRDNVTLNGLDASILQLNCALSDRKTTLAFELSDTNYGDHRVRVSVDPAGVREDFRESERPVIDVPADTLDATLAGLPSRWTNDIAVIWIDVQGYEGLVFSGARRTLERGIPVVSEVWPYGIMRAGMTLDAFSALVGEIWQSFWVRRRGRFVRYPVLAFRAFLDELGSNGDYENVVFTCDREKAN